MKWKWYEIWTLSFEWVELWVKSVCNRGKQPGSGSWSYQNSENERNNPQKKQRRYPSTKFVPAARSGVKCGSITWTSSKLVNVWNSHVWLPLKALHHEIDPDSWIKIIKNPTSCWITRAHCSWNILPLSCTSVPITQVKLIQLQSYATAHMSGPQTKTLGRQSHWNSALDIIIGRAEQEHATKIAEIICRNNEIKYATRVVVSGIDHFRSSGDLPPTNISTQLPCQWINAPLNAFRHKRSQQQYN